MPPPAASSQAPAADEDDAGDDLPEQPPRRQLDGQPRGEEAGHEEHPALAGRQGVGGVQGADDADDEEGRAHASFSPASDDRPERVLVSARGVQHRGLLRARRRPRCPTGPPWCAATSVGPSPSSTSGPTGSPTTWPPQGVGRRRTSASTAQNCAEWVETMLGCVQAAGRPDQRELPLRRGRAALHLRQRRPRRRRLPTRSTR